MNPELSEKAEKKLNLGWKWNRMIREAVTNFSFCFETGPPPLIGWGKRGSSSFCFCYSFPRCKLSFMKSRRMYKKTSSKPRSICYMHLGTNQNIIVRKQNFPLIFGGGGALWCKIWLNKQLIKQKFSSLTIW